jgi:hypothetical protein
MSRWSLNGSDSNINFSSSLGLGHCDLTRKISGEVTTKILYRDLKKFTQHTVGGVGGGSEGADNG